MEERYRETYTHTYTDSQTERDRKRDRPEPDQASGSIYYFMRNPENGETSKTLQGAKFKCEKFYRKSNKLFSSTNKWQVVKRKENILDQKKGT